MRAGRRNQNGSSIYTSPETAMEMSSRGRLFKILSNLIIENFTCVSGRRTRKLKMDITLFLQQFLNGLSIGSAYAIFALGYTLIFSILGIINFAHGAIFTLGAYFTYALMGGAFGFSGLLANASLPVQLPFVLALILGSTLAGLVGVAV